MRLQPRTARQGLLTLSAVTYLATLVACGPGSPPELDGLTDQVAQVGVEFTLDLNGTDADGDQLSYRYRAADLPDIGKRAGITVSPSGSGVFRWTPIADDLGAHSFDFIVSDGSNDVTVTININVKSAVGSATAPLFRQPLGTGTTIDLTQKQCVDFDVVIEDQDSAQVTLALEDPKAEGMRLDQEDGLTGKFNWCPTREQQAEQRYTAVLSADDGDNPKAIKNYLIVLRGGSGSNCPGSAPVITHTPSNETTILDLTIGADVSDDKGLKEPPLFYYSLTNPGANPDLGTMTQLQSISISGTPTSGTYAVDVPNPVANMPLGTSRTIYYVFVADDDDDAVGNCDHSTQSQVYQMTVTAGGTANLPICAHCSADAQCGAGDLCTYVGSMGDTYCLQACGAGCPTGYTCSVGNVYSVDGAEARQCVPINGSCSSPTAACVDDDNEDDDNQSQAAANAAVRGPIADNDFIVATLCPKPVQPPSGSKADDDWRQLKITQDTKIDMYLEGGGEADIDLVVYTSSGTLAAKSTSLGYKENVVQCLKPGTYYVKVNGFTNARTDYTLDYLPTAQTCDTSCVDDSYEQDDTGTTARMVSTNPYTATNNVMCPNDDDWYKVHLAGGKTLTMDMTSTSTGDLDFHLYESLFSDLWPCAYGSSSTCTSDHGQSAGANEHAVFTAPSSCGTAGCDYYVVVRGYNGASNTNYSITLKVQ